jgi:hypothetical protein
MMEAVLTSEPPVNFNVTTRRYIPEDSKLHTRRLENVKSHNMPFGLLVGRLYFNINKDCMLKIVLSVVSYFAS